jgi:hypothetical protein
MRHVQAHDPLAPLKAAAKLAQKQGVANDPLAWAKLTLPDVKFWSKQLEIITAVDQHSRVAVRACHDSSKSFTAAVIAARWLDTHPAGSARVITTAPTGTQVRAILWVEINRRSSDLDRMVARQLPCRHWAQARRLQPCGIPGTARTLPVDHH